MILKERIATVYQLLTRRNFLAKLGATGISLSGLKAIASGTNGNMSKEPNISGIDKESPTTLIPRPLIFEEQADVFSLDANIQIYVAPDAKPVADIFTAQLSKSAGWTMSILNAQDLRKGKHIAIVLDKSDDSLGAEGYSLSVTETKIEIKGQTQAGVFYGMQTLRQLCPLDIESKKTLANEAWAIPQVRIIDRPWFKYRGLLLDPARCMHSVEFTKRYIDIMAYLKLNVLHWHLTDDQGWRIEIKKYPKFTAGKEKGTFFTQEEISDLVSYAQARHITIVPEIEMPGHSGAMMRAYPEYSCHGQPPKKPQRDAVMPCLGSESTYEFLE